MENILCSLKLLGNQMLFVLPFIVNGKWLSERNKDSHGKAERIIVTAVMVTNKHVTLQNKKVAISKIVSVLVPNMVTHQRVYDMLNLCNQLQLVLFQNLKLTERVMYFHSLRVHLHICHWKYLNLHYLTTKEWEWRFVDNMLKPIKTDMQPPPESTLKFVRCKCKSTTKYVCRKKLFMSETQFKIYDCVWRLQSCILWKFCGYH